MACHGLDWGPQSLAISCSCWDVVCWLGLARLSSLRPKAQEAPEPLPVVTTATWVLDSCYTSLVCLLDHLSI